MSSTSDSIHLRNIDTNISNIYSMLNIMSNTMIISQLQDIRRPRLNTSVPSLVRQYMPQMSQMSQMPQMPQTTPSPLNTTNATNSTSNISPTTRLPNSLSNLFSTMFRTEGLPSGGIAMGFGNMDISVQNNTEDQNIVISHHNIFNNTKIKLKT